MRTRPLTALIATAAALAGGAALASARDDTPSAAKERLAVIEPPPFFTPGALPPFLPEGDLADQLATELDVPVDRVRAALTTIQKRHQEKMEAAMPPLPPAPARCTKSRRKRKRCPVIRFEPPHMPVLPSP